VYHPRDNALPVVRETGYRQQSEHGVPNREGETKEIVMEEQAYPNLGAR
jgi:hypothetical protein